jgi:hypothetical protein
MSREFLNHWAVIVCVAAICVYFIGRMYDSVLRHR